MKEYKARQQFTTEEQELILSKYKTMSAKGIADLINTNNPTRSSQVTDQQVYGLLRQSKRVGQRNIRNLQLTNPEEAEQLQKKIEEYIPIKKNTNDALLDILKSLETTTGNPSHV